MITEYGEEYDYQQPVKRLAAAMITRAYTDITVTNNPLSSKAQKVQEDKKFRRDAYRWAKSADNHFLSLKHCCEVLGIPYERTRSKLVGVYYAQRKKLRNSRNFG